MPSDIYRLAFLATRAIERNPLFLLDNAELQITAIMLNGLQVIEFAMVSCPGINVDTEGVRKSLILGGQVGCNLARFSGQSLNVASQSRLDTLSANLLISLVFYRESCNWIDDFYADFCGRFSVPFDMAIDL